MWLGCGSNQSGWNSRSHVAENALALGEFRALFSARLTHSELHPRKATALKEPERRYAERQRRGAEHDHSVSSFDTGSSTMVARAIKTVSQSVRASRASAIEGSEQQASTRDHDGRRIVLTRGLSSLRPI